jgi:hypothetical protein
MITEASKIYEGPDAGQMSQRQTAPEDLRGEGMRPQGCQAEAGNFVNRIEVVGPAGVLKDKAGAAGLHGRNNGKVVAVATPLIHSKLMFPNLAATLSSEDPLPAV